MKLPELTTQSIQQAAWDRSSVALLAINQHDLSIHACNPALSDLCGWRYDELHGMYLRQIFTPAAEQKLRECLADPEFSGVVSDLEIDQQGQLIPVDFSIAARLQLDQRKLLIGGLRDLRSAQATQKTLALREWELSAYSQAAMALTQARDEHDLMQRVCQALTDENRYCLAWVGVPEAGDDCPITVQAIAGKARAYLDGVFVSWSEQHPGGRGPTGRAIRSGQTQCLSDAQQDPNFAYWRERAASFGIRSSIAIPFEMAGAKRAALMVYSPLTEAFNAASSYLFEQLAGELGHGLRAFAERRQLEAERQHRETTQAQLASALTATIKAMAKTMESRDSYTAGHQERVAQIAVAMARKLGWNEARILGLEMAAIVHDIGKIAVPIEILTKPRRLSASEFALIKEHPETGYQILQEIPFPWPIAEIVRQHHEKLDGSGYPRGLKGAEILAEAQVLAVADIVESMASYRPYRPALGIERALDEIRNLSGTQLDEDIVACCLELFVIDHFDLPVHPA